MKTKPIDKLINAINEEREEVYIILSILLIIIILITINILIFY